MLTKRKTIGWLLAAIALLALVIIAQPAQAIGGGAPDGAGHPNVGLIGYDVDGPDGASPPFGLCTGFVVSDSVFVTAAHCIEVAPDASWAVTLASGSPTDPLVTPGIYPDDFPFPMLTPVTYAEEVTMHPQYGEGRAQANDVAVLRFAEGTFAYVTPVELPSEGQLDALAARGSFQYITQMEWLIKVRELKALTVRAGLLGQDFTLVGYGAVPSNDSVPQKQILGYRKVAQAQFQALTPRSLVLRETTNGNSAGFVCIGDSGGPQFYGDSNLAVSMVGVANNESDRCGVGTRFMQRLDTPSVRDFLGQFVALP